MKTPQARGVDSRRLYLFESFNKSISPYADKQRRLDFLKEMAGLVWAKHGRKGLPTPEIQFGEGMTYAGGKASFCDGFSYIELAGGQRNVRVLLHEVAHAMGFGNPHGPGFVRKYFDLLAEYGRCDRDTLAADARLFGL